MRKTDASASKSARPEPSQTSFGRCLVDGDATAASRDRRSRRRALGLSFAIEIGALVSVVLAPLLTSVAQPHLIRSAYIPFIGRPLRGRPGVKAAPPNRPNIYDRIPISLGMEPSRPAPHSPGESGGDIEISGGGPIGDTFGLGTPGFLQPANPVAPPPQEIKKNSERRSLKLSEGVVQAQLISRVEPRYPPLALQIRLQGTVRLQAIINRDGRITSLEVVSGHPLLVQSALDAVRQWRYRPTMLDGGPVEVETTISVVFQLHS
jgi:protein TonB